MEEESKQASKDEEVELKSQIELEEFHEKIRVESIRDDELKHKKNAIAVLREKVEVNQQGLSRMRQSDAESGRVLEEEAAVLSDESEGLSPGAYHDKILMKKVQKDDQLLGNIKKCKASIVVDNRKIFKLESEVRQLEKARDDEAFVVQAQNVCEKLGDFIGAFQAAEKSLLDVKSAIFSCQESRFHQRAVGLGFPRVYEVIFDSILNFDYLAEIGLIETLERISNLGNSYSDEPLIEKANSRLRNVPLVRDGSVLPSWMSGRDS